jgi:hypothetical protein
LAEAVIKDQPMFSQGLPGLLGPIPGFAGQLQKSEVVLL